MIKASAYLRTRAFRVQENLRARGDEGATATEYGLLVAFVAFAIIIGVTAFGGALNGFFNELTTAVNAWNPN